MFELNETVIWILGLIISALVFAVKRWQAASGKKVSKKVVGAILYVLAFVVVLFFGVFALPIFPVLPTFPDEPAAIVAMLIPYIGLVLGYLGQWFTLLTAVAGFAVLPYEFLYKGVYEKLFPEKEKAAG